MALAGIALDQRAPRMALLLAGAAAIVQFLMFAELLALIEMLLIDGPLWADAPLAALAVLPVLASSSTLPRLRPALACRRARCAGPVGGGIGHARGPAPNGRSASSIDYYREANFGTAQLGDRDQAGAATGAFPGKLARRTLCPTTAARAGWLRRH